MSKLTRTRLRTPTLGLSPVSLLLLAAVSSAAIGQVPDKGTWRIYYEPSRERVQLHFAHYENGARRHGTTSFGVGPTELRGLPLSQLSSYSGPVRFQLVRDAGTFNFDGQMRDGHGTGFFTFSPDSRFPQRLASGGCHSSAEGVISMSGKADHSCNAIFPKLGHIPERNKDLVMLYPDDHGSPRMRAQHGVCTSWPLPADTYDYYFCWKQFDALCSAAFDGTDEPYTLDDSPEHRFTGVWSDGVPIRELKIQEAAPIVP